MHPDLRLFRLGVGCVLGPALALAQAAPTPGTPAACRDAMKQDVQRYVSEARTAGRPAHKDTTRAMVRRGAAACITRFDAATINRTHLADLAVLQLDAGHVDIARRIVEQSVSIPGLSDSARAAAFVDGIRVYRSGGLPLVPEAEALLARLDALPGVPMQRIVGHGILSSYYSNYDIDDKLGASVRTILSLAKGLTPAQQRQAWKPVVTAIRNLAAFESNELRPDSAIALLRRAPSEFPALDSLGAALAEDIARYALVGTKAPPLNADYWINRPARIPAGAATPPLAGGVSLLVFTANWCHSCPNSYPVIRRLSKALKDRGFHVTFAVSLDGQFEGTRMTPEQEVEANREYFVTKHGFDHPVVIQRPMRPDAPVSPPSAAPNFKTYMLRALPQFIVIDRAGTIRAVLMGWDPYGRREKALTTVVRKLVGA